MGCINWSQNEFILTAIPHWEWQPHLSLRLVFTTAAISFLLFSITIQLNHNLDGTWYIAHLHIWPQNGHVFPCQSGTAPNVSGQSGLQIYKQQLAFVWPVAAATDPPSTDLVGLNKQPTRNAGYVICLVCTRSDPKKFWMFPISANHGAWKIDCRVAPNTLLLREKILLLSHENGIVTAEFLRYLTSKLSKNRWVFSN